MSLRVLPPLPCPSCHEPMLATAVHAQPTKAERFEDCLRRCERCGIGASNGKRPTYIYREPFENIPAQSRTGAAELLARSQNIRNRSNKLTKFGFSTSEDAVTWVVFTYLQQSGRLVEALKESTVIDGHMGITPTVLLWGAPLDGAL